MNWGEFKDLVKEHLPLDAEREGIQQFLPNIIKAAALDMQSHVFFYRKNHETLLVYEDFALDNKASTGALPDGAMLNEAYLIFDVDSSGGAASDVDASEDTCKKIRLSPYSWRDRFNLVCGCETEGKIAVSEHGEIYVYPAVESGDGVLLYYDQLKSDFLDAESVPFDQECGYAVSLYVGARIADIVDKDLPLSRDRMAMYVNERARILLDKRNRQRIRMM